MNRLSKLLFVLVVALVVTVVLFSFNLGPFACDEDLWAFVSSFDGMPYTRALEFRQLKEAPRCLRKWLKDRKQIEAWTNVIAVLGILGDDRDIDDFKKLILHGSRKVRHPLLRERAVALQALAFLAHEADKAGRRSDAFETLLAFTEARYLETHGVSWPGVDDPQRQELFSRELERQALLFLALTGERRAIDRIEARQNDFDKPFVDHLRALHKEISDAQVLGQGLEEYYARHSSGILVRGWVNP